MGKDSKMLTASDGDVVPAHEEESMSDMDYEGLQDDEETDDEDEAEFDDDTSEDEGVEQEDEVLEDVGEEEEEEEVLNSHQGRASRLRDGCEDVDQDQSLLESGALGMDETNGEVIPGQIERQRTVEGRNPQLGRNSSWEQLFGMKDAEWDDESDDDDWSPVSALNLRPHWFCVNCTMPNSDKLSFCSKCGESVESEILKRGHLCSPLGPTPSTADAGLNIDLSKGASSGSLDMLTGSSEQTTEDSKSSRTLLGFDERMLLHYEVHMKSHPHPERPDRLRAILSGLAAEGLYPGRCSLLPAREVTRTELEQVHSAMHVDVVDVTRHEELRYFTSDTYANKDSAQAANLAAGICADLAAAIVNGEAQNGFALVRPPGHHAEHVNIMGFCLHNNAGVAAKAAQTAGAKKVLIVDWDVHHGNGTQDLFDDDPTVLYVSLHRHEGGTFYPGTGAATEVGVGSGTGTSVNIPWICGGIGDNDYVFAFLHIVLPIAKQFAPDLTIISAGFDAAMGDPLGGCEVSPLGYAQMTSLLKDLSGGKLLVVLEGGYNLRSISASAAAVIKVLVGEDPVAVSDNLRPSEAGAVSMFDVFAVQSQYWPNLQIPLFVQHFAHFSSRSHSKELLLGELDQHLESSPSEQLGQPVGSPACLG